MTSIKGKWVAVLADGGFSKTNFERIKKALESNGVKYHIVSVRMGRTTSWEKNDWSSKYTVDANLQHAEPSFYDGLVLPGGIIGMARLKKEAAALKFISHFPAHEKPVAAIEFGLWPLTSVPGLKGMQVAADVALKGDLENAGAVWTDQPACRDKWLVTGRSEDDAMSFVSEMIDCFSELM